MVSKDDLIFGVWKGRIISDSTLNSSINAVRHAVGDSGETQRFIRTIPRKGFRFVGTVCEVAESRKTVEQPAPLKVESALSLLDKPSIAVLPFQNLSGDVANEYFVDGMVEDITTALSQFGQLLVVARSSSFTYKGRNVDVKQIGQELGVRYLLEGSIRKVVAQVRITARLIDSQTECNSGQLDLMEQSTNFRNARSGHFGCRRRDWAEN